MLATRLVAAVLASTLVVVAPSFADKNDKKHDKQEAKDERKRDKHAARDDRNDTKHEQKLDKRTAKAAKKLARHEAKWMPSDLSNDERKEWKDGRPPGWSRGVKRGWGGRDCPPGLVKTGRCPEMRAAAGPAVADPRRPAGSDRLRDALERLGRWGRDRRVSGPTLDASLVGFEGAVRHGVPIPLAERLVMISAERGVSPYGIEAITRALAYGADRRAPLTELGTFAEHGVARDVAADAIALGIYRLVAERR